MTGRETTIGDDTVPGLGPDRPTVGEAARANGALTNKLLIKNMASTAAGRDTMNDFLIMNLPIIATAV